MKAKVCTFHIAYEGFEDKIYRVAEVSNNYTVAQLGYLVLATFDTLAYHAFNLEYNGLQFELPMMIEEDFFPKDETIIDATAVKLQNLQLAPGAELTMTYDFGCSQTFRIRLLEIADMELHTGRRYPRISEGQGRGILDDVSPEEFAELIETTDRTGKSDYYIERFGHKTAWDYRRFDLKGENILLKGEISRIQDAYECLEYDDE